ncbi:hypothetical protein U1707_14440 [Sphingomonas sp. PB2P12]|uniref:hypothetical protein n=1 Tax=Sphingomonas sandaracina TaxID=3096157 RepID=UPI002FCC7516
MKFNREGASYITRYPMAGAWRVSIPWSVAIDALYRETRRMESGEAELKTWMSEHETDFTGIVFARVGIGGRPSWDDPRITYEQIEAAEPDDDDE